MLKAGMHLITWCFYFHFCKMGIMILARLISYMAIFWGKSYNPVYQIMSLLA
jgi:hypothetical protein